MPVLMLAVGVLAAALALTFGWIWQQLTGREDAA
jgi:hypothetical protein